MTQKYSISLFFQKCSQYNNTESGALRKSSFLQKSIIWPRDHPKFSWPVNIEKDSMFFCLFFKSSFGSSRTFLSVFTGKKYIAKLFAGNLRQGFTSSCLIAALIFLAGYYSAAVFYNSKNLNCIGALFFLRCVHTFFNDFDLSKRDKQVKPSRH